MDHDDASMGEPDYDAGMDDQGSDDMDDAELQMALMLSVMEVRFCVMSTWSRPTFAHAPCSACQSIQLDAYRSHCRRNPGARPCAPDR